MNIKLTKLVVATLTGTALLGFGANAFADSTDDILNALIAKGVLTEEEGALLLKGRELEKETKIKKPDLVFKDGMTIATPDGKHSISLGGRIHADYRAFDHGNNENQTTGNTANESDTFDVRRARIELKGKFYEYYDFQFSGDFAGQTNGNTGASLDQAWVNIGYYKPIQVKIGQFKVPLSMERKMSSNALDFMERSQHDTLSTYEDRGVMLWGVPKDGLTYALAVVNGEGNKNRNDSDSRVSKPEYQANATINFAQLMDNKDAVYHLGFGASTTDISKTGNLTGFPTGNNNTLWFAGSNQARTEARGVNYLTMPSIGSVANVSNEISRQRYNLEAAVAYGPVKVVAEYLKNDFSGDLTTTTSFDKSVKAWYASALWNISGEKFADFYKEGVFAAVKPKNNFDFTKFTGGAWQLGARYSKFDASDFNNSVFATSVPIIPAPVAVANVLQTNRNSSTFEADAYTIGINFVPTPNTRFMLNYVQTNFDTPILIEGSKEDKEKAITFRSQFNF
jgi:phosphate-selective porin OprO and OprP